MSMSLGVPASNSRFIAPVEKECIVSDTAMTQSAHYASVQEDDLRKLLPDIGNSSLSHLLAGAMTFAGQPFTVQSKPFVGNGVAIPVKNLPPTDLRWMQDNYAISKLCVGGWADQATGEVLQGDVVMVFGAIRNAPDVAHDSLALDLKVRDKLTAAKYEAAGLNEALEKNNGPVAPAVTTKTAAPGAAGDDGDYADAPEGKRRVKALKQKDAVPV